MGSAVHGATAAVLLVAAGCSASSDRSAVLDQLTPMMANNNVPLPALISGGPFRPSYQIDAVSASANIDAQGFSAYLSPSDPSAGESSQPGLSNVIWATASTLQAVLPAGIAAGTYDLVVRDPRGQSSRLPQAFTSLGPDLIPPVVTITSPTDDSFVGAESQVVVVIHVDDGWGQIVRLQANVRTGTASIFRDDCTAAAEAQTDCTFSFMAPTPLSDPAILYVDATAIDGGGNAGTAETVLELVPPPVPTSLSPVIGSTLGGTLVTVVGSSFVFGATAVLFDGVSATLTMQQSPSAVAVLTPPHLAGPVVVTVDVGGAVETVPDGFLYVDPPVVREISPTYGPTSGGTPVRVVGDNFDRNTQIFMGGQPLACATFQNAHLIVGSTPPGFGQVSVGAYEPTLDAPPPGSVAFDYGADGPGAPDGTADGGPPAPAADAGCPGSGP
jgi:IPT/TIG domain